MDGKRKLTAIVILVITMIIGLAMTPTIQESVNDVTDTTNGSGYGNNLTGGAFTLAGIIPLLYIVVILAVPLAAIYKLLVM